MNIFVDPGRMPPEMFSAVAGCLSAHKNDLNGAMARLPAAVPAKDEQFLHILRLGGIADELPPLKDPAFADELADMRSATEIPAYGTFLIYPGRSVSGRLAGHAVRFNATDVSSAPDIRFEVDGVVVGVPPNVEPTNTMDMPTTVPSVSRGPMGSWIINGPACDHRSDDCGVMIQFGGQQGDDPAEWVSVLVKMGPYNQYSADPGWP